MIVTEAELRDQLRRPVAGAKVTVAAGARLSPAARDFVKQFALVLVEEGGAEGQTRDWDHDAVFPVALSGEAPRCTQCGTGVTRKPSALTQLNASHYAPKTHPRIKLRGRIDSLHARVLWLQRLAYEAGEEALVADLASLAAYCRELISAEYNERPVADLRLAGLDPDTMHRATHDPRSTLGVEHLTLDHHDDELQHLLNLARTESREIEILALETFPSPHVHGATICHALNRVSSAFYYLQLRRAAVLR